MEFKFAKVSRVTCEFIREKFRHKRVNITVRKRKWLWERVESVTRYVYIIMAVCWNVAFFFVRVLFIFRKRCATHEWTKNPFIWPSTIHLCSFEHIRSSCRVIIDRLLSASEIKQFNFCPEIQFDFFTLQRGDY